MKKSKIIILISILIVISTVFLITKKDDNKYIKNIIKSEAYSYLSNDAKKFIESVYNETKEVVLTEKNKKDNEPYLNPEFVHYLSLSKEEKKNVEVIPDIYITDYVYEETKGTYPSSFDLRNVDGKKYISPLKDQASLGICWSFAANEQAESYILQKDGIDFDDNPIELSPRQLDYATSTNGILNYENEYGFRSLTTGGGFLLAAQALSSGVSLVKESDFPFNELTTKKNLSEVLNHHYSQYEVNTTINMPELADVTDTDLLNSYVSNLKEIIYNNGGAVISAQDPQGSCGALNTDGTLVLRADNNCTSTIEHDMQIIGWDDNYEYRYCKNSYSHYQYNSYCSNSTSGTGAWIIRNSWGSDVATKYQYLYIPYDSNNYQVSASTNIESMESRTWDKTYVDTPFESPNEDYYVYYISGGFMVTFGSNTETTEKLEKIKFTTLNSNDSYRVFVQVGDTLYDDFDDVVTTYPGLYTVDVSSYNILIDGEFTIGVVANNDGRLLYRGISAFTSFIGDETDIKTDDITVTYTNKDIHKIEDLFVYSTTANIPSNSTITYELYDSENTDLTSHITNVTGNIVAHNNVNTKLDLEDLNPGEYTLKVIYDGQAFDANLTIVSPPTIYYHQNYGTDEVIEEVVNEGEETNLSPNTFTRTGYIFRGWNTDASGNGDDYADGASVTLSSDLILYAQWTPITYKIVFHSNNNANETNEETFTYDESKALLTNTFTYQGHKFKHWAMSIYDDAPRYADGETILNLASKNNIVINLYAIWCDEEVTITYYPMGGDGTMEPQTVDSLTDIKLNKNVYTRTGYNFVGWNTLHDGTGTNYTDEQIVNLTANINLYAQWTPITYKVIFHAENGTDDVLEQTLTYNQNSNLTLNTFSYPGHTFSHWETSVDYGSVEYTDGEQVINLTSVDNGEIHLYAKWDAVYATITFDANGGTGEMANKVLIIDTDTVLNENTFTRTGYTFLCWKTNPNGSGDNYYSNNIINIHEDLTLYAYWVPYSYSILYMGIGEQGGTYQYLSYDEYFTMPYVEPEVGYTFVGWNTDINGNGTQYMYGVSMKNLLEENNASIQLYPIYSPITYHIIFSPNGGIGEEITDDVLYDEIYSLKGSIFNRDGYNLVGWNTLPDGSGSSYSPNASVSNLTTYEDDNIILYAIWQEASMFNTTTYTIDETNKYIDDIQLETSFTKFIELLGLNGYNTMMSFDNVNTGFVYTGAVLHISNGNTSVADYKCIVRGDVNGDGKASSLDYVKIKNHIMGTNIITNPVFKLGADANKDGKISSLDYVRIKNIIMKG